MTVVDTGTGAHDGGEPPTLRCSVIELLFADTRSTSVSALTVLATNTDAPRELFETL